MSKSTVTFQFMPDRRCSRSRSLQGWGRAHGWQEPDGQAALVCRERGDRSVRALRSTPLGRPSPGEGGHAGR